MIFELNSDLDPNYRHIHTMKGIGQRQLGPWNQYVPVACVPATPAQPCTITSDYLDNLSARPPSGPCLGLGSVRARGVRARHARAALLHLLPCRWCSSGAVWS